MAKSWRRWDFWWGTCAAKRQCMHYIGAGHAPLSSLAAKIGYTCTKKPIHLRHVVENGFGERGWEGLPPAN